MHLCICIFVYLCGQSAAARSAWGQSRRLHNCDRQEENLRLLWSFNLGAYLCISAPTCLCICAAFPQLYDKDRLPARSLQFKFAPINFVQQNMCVRSTSGATEWRHDCLADRWVHALDANWHQSGQQFSQIHKNTKAQIYKYTKRQMYKYTNTNTWTDGC